MWGRGLGVLRPYSGSFIYILADCPGVIICSTLLATPGMLWWECPVVFDSVSRITCMQWHCTVPRGTLPLHPISRSGYVNSVDCGGMFLLIHFTLQVGSTLVRWNV